MQGKKQYQEKLFLSFQLSRHVPEDNFYRRLREAIDFSFLYSTTAAYYGTEGQKSVDPIVFMKLMLVGYLENINSDRRIVNMAKMRLDILYFLGYDLDEELPWHSTLSRTRQLYGQEVFSEVFQTVLNQCIDKGMVAGKRQAIDSVLIKANASLDSMIKREILEDASSFTAELDENSDEVKKKTVVELPSTHNGNVPPKKNPQNSTHYSPSDPEAKMAVKPGKATALNYLGQVSVDTASHVITHIEAFTADKRDSQCLPKVIKGVMTNLSRGGMTVEEVIADTGYSSGEALKALEEHNIRGYIPNRAQFVGERPGFIYHREGDYYTCPANERLTHRGTYESLPGIYNKQYRVSRKKCNKCPLKSECALTQKKEPVIQDTVDKEYYQRMHERMQTKIAARLMKQRQSTAEPVIGTLVNYLALRKVNTRGLERANKCMILSAVAYNLKKLLRFMSTTLQTKLVEMNCTPEKPLGYLISAIKSLCNAKTSFDQHPVFFLAFVNRPA